MLVVPVLNYTSTEPVRRLREDVRPVSGLDTFLSDTLFIELRERENRVRLFEYSVSNEGTDNDEYRACAIHPCGSTVEAD